MSFLAKSDTASKSPSVEDPLKFAHLLPGVIYQFRMRPDGSSCFPYASSALVDIYRVSLEVAMLDAEPVFRAIHPKDYDKVVASIHKSSLELSPWKCEYRVKFDDGTVIWLYGNALPEREADGGTLWHGFITDITEKKVAEAEAHQMLARLMGTLDALPDLMFEMNLDGKHCDFHSPRTEFLVRPLKELMGTLVNDVLPTEAAAIVMAALQEAHVSGYSSGKIYSLPMAKGKTWFELSIARKATEPGEEYRFIVLSRDITDRIHSEQKNFFSALAMNAIGQGVVIADAEGHIISTSKSFTDITGYAESENLGRQCTFLQGPLSDAKTISSMNLAMLRHEVFRGEILNYRKDGSTFWNKTSISPILSENGQLMHFVGAMEDITAAKMAELEVIRSNAEEQRLNRSLSMLRVCDAVIARAQDENQLLIDLCKAISNNSERTITWAGLVCAVGGNSIQPVAHHGQAGQELSHIKTAWSQEQAEEHSSTMLAIQTRLSQISSSQLGDPIHALWYKVVQSLRPHSVASIPLLNGDLLIGVLVIHCGDTNAFDATQMNLYEDLAQNIVFGIMNLRLRSELSRHQMHLEELVHERTLEIEVLNASLLQEKLEANAANNAKSDFLSNMSHELRTPLNAVLGLTSLMAQTPLSRRQLDYAEKIQMSANTLRTLIDDILDLSKIEANELHMENAPFSLHDLLANTASVLGVSVGGKPIEPVLDVALDVPDKWIGDALRVQQILLNLISNAVKFTQTGEIVLAVRYRTEPNTGNAWSDTLEFSVRDTGIGMTAETQRLIFNSFTQANESTSRLYGGTGLGLAISSRLAILMRGQLEVQSLEGQGTSFYLKLPLELDKLAAVGGRGQGLPPHTPSGLNVLIVDDHALVRSGLVQTCQQVGWPAVAVDSGHAGLQMLLNRAAQGHVFDVLLLDWHMPEMDGLAMLREVYILPDVALPPVVLMVATAEIEQAVRASAEFNIDGIIAKPMTPSSLIRSIVKATMADSQALELRPQENRQLLAGLQLLVAEDNELNREVIEQTLAHAGAQVTLVGNGQLALDALKNGGVPFDAVLMDIQMPVMDGYTATRHIRETLGLIDLPIIALTAHARPQDREKSRQSGMSGHLVKPLNVSALLDVVVKAVHMRSTAHQSHTMTNQQGAVILPGLDLGEALKVFGGDHAAYIRLLSKFKVQHGHDVLEAQRHFSAGRTTLAIQLLHGLSGIAGLLQFSALSTSSSVLESVLVDDQTNNVLVLFEELQLAMATVMASIERVEATYS